MYYQDEDKSMGGFQVPLFTADEGTWVGDIAVLYSLNKREICH